MHKVLSVDGLVEPLGHVQPELPRDEQHQPVRVSGVGLNAPRKIGLDEAQSIQTYLLASPGQVLGGDDAIKLFLTSKFPQHSLCVRLSEPFPFVKITRLEKERHSINGEGEVESGMGFGEGC